MIAFTHQGAPVTPGQALDVWVGAGPGTRVSWFERTHMFADAMYGHAGPIRALREAGIEITFGDEK